MRRDTFGLVTHSGSATFVLTLLALSLSSCTDSQSVRCSSGLFCPAGWRCSGNGEACILDSCGDGITQDHEACDDGNTLSGDGCNSTCSSNESCGNGFKDPGEVCDDNNTLSGDGCSSDCRSDETCGNGYRDLAKGEVCDDGNEIEGDKCSQNCRSDETCGNGFKDPGETCDDGNNDNGDGCSADCKVAGTGCGNGQIEANEECDDGNHNDHDDCLNDSCQLARCGDGITAHDASRREECDDGGETASCDLDCTWSKCGDGIVNGAAGEQCDNGAPDRDTAQCTKECRISYCGDGYHNTAAGEACDDGNGDYCGTCKSTCREARPAAHARGSIEAVPSNTLSSGESFTLYDGMYGARPVTFEFQAQPWLTTHIKIEGTAPAMANAIQNAINSYGPLQIRAAIDPVRNTRVLLTHVYPSSYGNHTISKRVSNASFKVEGMSDGNAGDCLPGVGCKSTEDCAPGLTCTDKICQ
jgi:cysteine-rich repeat protein